MKLRITDRGRAAIFIVAFVLALWATGTWETATTFEEFNR